MLSKNGAKVDFAVDVDVDVLCDVNMGISTIFGKLW
jgi:hypothetical protein